MSNSKQGNYINNFQTKVGDVHAKYQSRVIEFNSFLNNHSHTFHICFDLAFPAT